MVCEGHGTHPGQAPLLNVIPANSMSENLPPQPCLENLRCKRFHLIIPASRWATHSPTGSTHQFIHHRLWCNPCWKRILIWNHHFLFSKMFFIFFVNACQSLSFRGAYPTIERGIRFLTTSGCWNWFEANGQVVKDLLKFHEQWQNWIKKIISEFLQTQTDSEVCPYVDEISFNRLAIGLRCCKSTTA